jgi:phosphoribosylformylglycinamidine cyclo-ligase
VFGVLGERGGITGPELEHVFNMGVGMVAVVAASDAGRALGLLAARDVPAWLAGEIIAGTGMARLAGQHS